MESISYSASIITVSVLPFGEYCLKYSMKLRKIIVPVIIFVTSVFVLAVLFVTPLSETLMGFLRPVSRIDNVIGNVVEDVGGYFPASKQKSERIDELRSQVADLRMKLVRKKSVEQENRRLRKLLDMPLKEGWKVRYAQVITRDPLTWNRRFRIDKGRGDGVVAGAAVVEGEAVIGRVTSISEYTAVVATLADPGCALSVKLGEEGGVGILEGRKEVRNGRPVCRINYLPVQTSFDQQSTVVTSGLSKMIPGGLAVGDLVPWNSSKKMNVKNKVYKQAALVPAAGVDDVRFIRVLWKGQAGKTATGG